MTKEEAAGIPELQIHPNGLVEDAFFYKLAKAGKLSKEEGYAAEKRLDPSDPCYQGALFVADLMLENLEKYGVPCVDWCE